VAWSGPARGCTRPDTGLVPRAHQSGHAGRKRWRYAGVWRLPPAGAVGGARRRGPTPLQNWKPRNRLQKSLADTPTHPRLLPSVCFILKNSRPTPPWPGAGKVHEARAEKIADRGERAREGSPASPGQRASTPEAGVSGPGHLASSSSRNACRPGSTHIRGKAGSSLDWLRGRRVGTGPTPGPGPASPRARTRGTPQHRARRRSRARGRRVAGGAGPRTRIATVDRRSRGSVPRRSLARGSGPVGLPPARPRVPLRPSPANPVIPPRLPP
jgi:hypothetical protein